jgi:hypothetical protein
MRKLKKATLSSIEICLKNTRKIDSFVISHKETNISSSEKILPGRVISIRYSFILGSLNIFFWLPWQKYQTAKNEQINFNRGNFLHH